MTSRARRMSLMASVLVCSVLACNGAPGENQRLRSDLAPVNGASCESEGASGPEAVVQALYRDFPPNGSLAISDKPKAILSKYFAR